MRERRPPPAPSVDALASPLVYDKSAERAIVGRILLEPAVAPEVVGGGLRSAHFYGTVTKAAFAAIEALVERGDPADVDGVIREAHAQYGTDRDRVVTKAALASLLDGVPRGLTWTLYARRIREGAARRALHYGLRALASRVEQAPLSEIVRAAQALIDDAEIVLRPASLDRWTQLAAEQVEAYDRPAEADAVPSGFLAPDQRFGHWPRGSLVVVGARTSVGKTSLATTLASEHARAGRKVSFLSVEMDRGRIAQRMLGALTDISLMHLNRRSLTDDDLAEVSKALALDLPLCIDDQPRLWSEARARIRQHARELNGVDVVFVDYIQLLDPELQAGERRYEAIGRVSQGLKHLALDLRCVVVALAQLNRGAEDRDEPRLSDLRESGNLEQDADVVWLLWRHPKDAILVGGLVPTHLTVAKNRFGPTGEVRLQFRGPAMRFLEMAEDNE